MAFQAQCPGCAADLRFDTPGAVVKVCEYCHSIVARGEDAVANLGKVADIADSKSPLDVGLEGAWEGAKFSLTGRALLQHAAGGSWEEWYAAFDDGRWGWLAEAQGKFTLMFEREGVALPDFQKIVPGTAIVVDGEELRVAEIGQAAYAGARGELPFRLDPKEQMTYADLSGPAGRVATLDFGDEKVYVGRGVTLAELGLKGKAAAERPSARTSAERIACPECDGTLELRAPDATQRIGCPYCGTLLDVDQGKLKVFAALFGERVTPDLPLGASGTLEGARYTIIGFLRRSIELEEERYPWDEYLLAGPDASYRWLVQSEGNWSFVEPIAAGDVQEQGNRVTYAGKRYRQGDCGSTRVDHVLGEMTWKVAVGETVTCTDYLAPPEVLTLEEGQVIADGLRAAEANWSHGWYLPAGKVAEAFGQQIAESGAPGALSPSPYRGLATASLIVGGLFLAAAVLVGAMRPARAVYSTVFELPALPSAEGTQIGFSAPFELEPNRAVTITASTNNVNQSWLYLSGDLVEEGSGFLVEWDAELEWWYGVDDGESWTEDTRTTHEHLGAVPGGSYVVRIEAQWPDWQQPKSVQIEISQGGFRMPHFFVAGGLIAGAMALLIWLAMNFEKRRRGEL